MKLAFMTRSLTIQKINFFKNKQFAVERNYFSNELVFANHLLSVKDEDQIEKVFYGNNKKIPKNI